jgi:hypothetical protein
LHLRASRLSHPLHNTRSCFLSSSCQSGSVTELDMICLHNVLPSIIRLNLNKTTNNRRNVIYKRRNSILISEPKSRLGDRLDSRTISAKLSGILNKCFKLYFYILWITPRCQLDMSRSAYLTPNLFVVNRKNLPFLQISFRNTAFCRLIRANPPHEIHQLSCLRGGKSRFLPSFKLLPKFNTPINLFRR